MQKQLRRLGVAACAAIAVPAIPATGAEAAVVVATTGVGIHGVPAPTAEYLTGAVNTSGGATIWQFEYGTTATYGSKTPLEFIPAGRNFVIVASPVTGLRPNTTYHFRLDARAQLVGNYGYYYGVSGVGADQTFTTASAGTIRLSSTKLKVKKGRAGFGLKCNSTIRCSGRYSATVKGKVGGTKKTVSCFKGTFSIRPGSTGHFRPKVSRTCLGLFRHGKLKGVRLTAAPTTFQPKLTRKVTLRR